MAEIASAWVTLAPSARNFGRSLDGQISGQVTKSGKKAGLTWGKVFGIGAAIAVGRKAFDFLGDSLAEGREANKVAAATAQIIKTTGGTAKVTAVQVDALATAISNKTGIDDEQIATASNLLLTFKKVANQGEGLAAVFDRATQAATDLSSLDGMGGIEGAAKMLGKALEDPEKGLTALGRAGVQFTDQQKDAIAAMLETGDVLGAQKLILKEVESQVGGLAEAQATLGDKGRVLFGNLQEQIGTKLIPVVDSMTKAFIDAGPEISNAIDQTVDFGAAVGDRLLPLLADLGQVLADVAGFFDSLPGPVKTLGIEAAVAALVLPRLATALTSVGAAAFGADSKLRSFTTGLTVAETRSKTLGRGLLTIAGIGGMVAIQEGATGGSKAVGVLGEALTGAFVGGAIGSAIPGIGTAIGGVAGAAVGAGHGLLSMRDASREAAEAAAKATPTFDAYVGTLDQITGATTRTTRALIRQRIVESDVIGIAGQLGLSMSTLVNAALGQGDAVNRVNEAWLKHGNIAQGIENIKLGDFLQEQGIQIDEAKRKLDATNLTMHGTKKASAAAAKALADVGKDGPKTDIWAALFSGHLNRAVQDSRTGADKITKNLDSGPRNAKADLNPFRRLFNAGLDPIKKDAKSGGQGIGDSLEAGVIGGFSTTSAKLSALAASVVRNALRAARLVGGIFSPSKETFQIGLDLAQGLVNGLLKGDKKVSDATKKMVDGVKSQLATLKGDFASLSESIAGAFTGNLFEAETAAGFIANLTSTKGTLSALKAAFKTLIGWGLSPKFLSQLFASGNAALILDLAASGQGAAVEAATLFGDVQSLSTSLGKDVAGADLGPRLDKISNKLDRLIAATKNVGADVGHEVNGAARNGKRKARAA